MTEPLRPDAVSYGRPRRSAPPPPRRVGAPVSPFQRLATTHALLTVGDVALVVALADSFLSLDAGAARGKVLLYLLISFAPFAVIAPLIGPMVDRAAGGRRMMIQATALGRAVAYVLLMFTLDSLAMFPLAFLVMVLQKTYAVSKSAIVPSIVRNETELVEANSKLGLLAGISGGLGAIPFGVMALISSKLALFGGVVMFGAAFVMATKLPRDVVAAQAEQGKEREELRQPHLLLAATSFALIRGTLGFLFFHLFFWIRTEKFPTYWLGLAVASVTVGVMVGNGLAPLLRKALSERVMIIAALALVAVAGVLAALAGGVGAAVGLSIAVNMASAVARMAFESIVQRSAPDANQGRAFAKFETRFQLSWVLSGVLPTLFTMPGWVGFLIVGVAGAVGLVAYLAGGFGVLRARAGLPTIQELRTRRGSAARQAGTAVRPSDARPPDRRPRR